MQIEQSEEAASAKDLKAIKRDREWAKNWQVI
jgi:hypothetical protein